MMAAKTGYGKHMEGFINESICYFTNYLNRIPVVDNTDIMGICLSGINFAKYRNKEHS